MRQKSPSLYFFERHWHKLDPSNLQIDELDPQRYQMKYTIQDTEFTVILRKNTKLFKELDRKRSEYLRIFRINMIKRQQLLLRKKAENRAKLLVKRVISSDPKLSNESGSIDVLSSNQRKFVVKDNVFELVEEDTVFRCVYVCNNHLPPSDQALAKALVIAHRPDLIYTLNGIDDSS